MISFPHAKINLGLNILSKREDGYHNLETVFYPIAIRDALEIVPSDTTKIILTGLKITGNPEDNLILRAYQVIKENYPSVSPLEIHLHKAIPMGAGLGGGSSDAAEMILLMNHYFNLQIPEQEKKNYAARLGSDCPFFLHSDPCFAKGRGEILEPVKLDLSSYSILLIHPDIQVKTDWAYSRIKPGDPVQSLKESILQPVYNWPHLIFNDFELPVFEEYPQLRKIKDDLYTAGALYAAMSGSGSTIFGIFNRSELPVIHFPNSWQTAIQR
jgi:4-diphosphocytidyl-2-C-methyl-D-erythritol kinase